MSDGQSVSFSDFQDREVPPMPVGATVRNDKPVAVLRFRDGEGQELELHIAPATNSAPTSTPNASTTPANSKLDYTVTLTTAA